MEDSEGVHDYISRVLTIVNQIWELGHKLGQSEVVSKVLRSLAAKFDFVAVAIEESKEISKFILDDFSGTVQAHEVRVNRASAKFGEKALHVKGESTSANQSKEEASVSSWDDGRGRGRSFTRGRGRCRFG
ncbi:uncharacterized protein LOC120283343 [Dioscorea cayenensis subsp. rotundata]|uniref:Uncharacterized protein LOC120283343 n=1 Tax=Dioscorea cayennensis subsp. rotundata TaxID=55577 RepID=A0AB40D149_DIOCR|nr:uncharacterized protein LOC120283343 [Dioscorea cayenensis subsp. rotundata]